MVVWDPNEIWGGLEPEAVKRARIILWKGHCSVHTRFTVRQIENLRAQHPGLRVIVHPEVTWEVVQAADESGSTEHIIKRVTESPEGSIWAVGTEIHLVNRLARQVHPARTVLSLDQFGCLCSTMFRVSPNHLLWTLEGLLEGRRAQPHRRAGRPEVLDEGRAGPHVVDPVAPEVTILRFNDGRPTRQGGSFHGSDAPASSLSS